MGRRRGPHRELTGEQRFIHRLALALGRTVAELRHTLGCNELRDWEAYYQVEPWGQLRDNMHAGLVAAALANQNRRRGGKVATYKDYLLEPASERRADNRAKFFSAMRAMAKRGGDNG